MPLRLERPVKTGFNWSLLGLRIFDFETDRRLDRGLRSLSVLAICGPDRF